MKLKIKLIKATTHKLEYYSLWVNNIRVYGMKGLASIPGAKVETVFEKEIIFTNKHIYKGVVAFEDWEKLFDENTGLKEEVYAMMKAFDKVHSSMSDIMSEHDMDRMEKLHFKDFKILGL